MQNDCGRRVIILATKKTILCKYLKLPDRLYQAKGINSILPVQKKKTLFCFILSLRLPVGSEILIRKVILLIFLFLSPCSLGSFFLFTILSLMKYGWNLLAKLISYHYKILSVVFLKANVSEARFISWCQCFEVCKQVQRGTFGLILVNLNAELNNEVSLG